MNIMCSLYCSHGRALAIRGSLIWPGAGGRGWFRVRSSRSRSIPACRLRPLRASSTRLISSKVCGRIALIVLCRTDSSGSPTAAGQMPGTRRTLPDGTPTPDNWRACLSNAQRSTASADSPARSLPETMPAQFPRHQAGQIATLIQRLQHRLQFTTDLVFEKKFEYTGLDGAEVAGPHSRQYRDSSHNFRSLLFMDGSQSSLPVRRWMWRGECPFGSPRETYRRCGGRIC